ncbi:MAG: 2'-5' RNA ligase family protein [Candidatus Shapirobacteria bacterium]|nr:2'-5' RNA ligase family protein [Candidatus Shapirobacteria bacterium]
MSKERRAFLIDIIPPKREIVYLNSVKSRFDKSSENDNKYKLRPHLTLIYPFYKCENSLRTNLTEILSGIPPFIIKFDRVEKSRARGYGVIMLTPKSEQSLTDLNGLRRSIIENLGVNNERNKDYYLPHITLNRNYGRVSDGELRRQRSFFDKNIDDISFMVDNLDVRMEENGRWKNLGEFILLGESKIVDNYQINEYERALV